jgi:hypothetical protein
MNSSSRDDFPDKTKRIVAERSAYICANPTCRRPTVGPHSDPDKSLKTGEACHIRAASSGGPRYDPEQSPQERSGIENAIWLCTECSTCIDKDEASYPPPTLLEWKGQHESWIRNGGIVPALPDISLISLKGRTLPDTLSTITARDCEDFREHSLQITNRTDVEIVNIDARVQLPEPIIENLGQDKPPGVNVVWQPMRPQMIAHVKGGGSVTRGRPPLPTNVYQLRVDRIPPSHGVGVGFVTSTTVFEEHDMSFDRGPFAGTNDPPFIRTFINGTFQFQYRGALLKKRFFAPIQPPDDTRQFRILEIREDFGKWQPLEMTVFS